MRCSVDDPAESVSAPRCAYFIRDAEASQFRGVCLPQIGRVGIPPLTSGEGPGAGLF